MVTMQQDLRFGVVQGRLMQAPAGHLQWFPQDAWEAEFFVAAALGIDYIELVAERSHNPGNPLWSAEGVERINALVLRNKLATHAFCNDYIIDHCLIDDDEVVDQSLRLAERGALLGCEKYIFPLFEKSELTVANLAAYIDPLRAIADKVQAVGITLCLETGLHGAALADFLDRIAHPAIKAVYDTGNRVAFGHDLPGDIRLLGDRIAHVHIKDKNADNENVLLGRGLVDFLRVYEALADIGYSGPYTFETVRGNDPLRTAAHNLAFARFFHAEARGE
ncbi:MAG: sugar phosphate isomerase/epimerase [Betaproteobacteria bacterium]|nr:sugar phosphate isomerase/epimerase [Betaproteobacteria bacterium]